jgi:hypothetical protein
MAKMTFEQPVQIDSLGKRQQPILETLAKDFPGSTLGLIPLPKGRAGLSIYWTGFYGHDMPDREEMVHASIAKIGAGASKGIVMIITLTPEEAEDSDER